METMNVEDINQNHPAVKTLAALIQGEGHITDVRPLFALLDELNRQYNPQDSIDPDEYANPKLADKLDRMLNSMVKHSVDENKNNLTLGITDDE